MTAVQHTPCVTDLQLEAWHELQAAKRALHTRDDLVNRERLKAARERMDDVLGPSHDCE